MKSVLLLATLVISAVSGAGESSSTVLITFSNPGLNPSDWSLQFHRDGSGHFKSQHGNPPTRDEKLIEAPDIDRDIHLSPAFAEHAFHIAKRHRFFATECDSHAKVAFQGNKTLSYNGPEGQGSCEFNYSRDSEIQDLGDSLVAVATTLIEGARLETLLQHDPLGLDKEIQTVQDAAGDGRAQQICSIKEILERLSEDPSVMERVRKRAKALLARVEQ